MKVRIDIDCTAEEARAFFGLPDVRPLQQVWLREMETRLKEGLSAVDAEALLKRWMPLGAEALGEMQKAFWASFAGGQQGKGKGPAGA
ncbi:MAG: hypothetical protein HY521_08440 [Proteobacteria bacterium]|nr:hypothetical protein [Pseudomonadota bacterium]